MASSNASISQKKSLLDVPLAEWPELISSLGEPDFRAGQLAEWVFKRRVRLFSEMTNLSAALREKLSAAYTVGSLEVDNAVTSDIDGYDRFYKRLIRATQLTGVSSAFSMEQIKETTALPLEPLI